MVVPARFDAKLQRKLRNLFPICVRCIAKVICRLVLCKDVRSSCLPVAGLSHGGAVIAPRSVVDLSNINVCSHLRKKASQRLSAHPDIPASRGCVRTHRASLGEKI